MKKIVRLSESNLIGLVSKVINEKKGQQRMNRKLDHNDQLIFLQYGDQSDIDNVMSLLMDNRENIKFFHLWFCDGFVDFSGIDMCELPELEFVGLKGTKSNFEELFDCYDKFGDNYYDMAKPYFKDDRISDVPEPRFSMNESDLSRLVKKIVNEDTKKEDPTVSFMWRIKKRLKGISDDQLDYNMRNDLPWDWKGTKEGFYEKMEPKGKNSGSN